jgi:hypothetical protein
VAIEDGDVATELYRRLEMLPFVLKDLYARILSKIPLEHRHQTFNYLQILVPSNSIPRGPSWLLGMVLAILPSKEALTSRILSMTETDMIAECTRTKKILQSKCRGLITLPIRRAQWCREEVLEKFCVGDICVHKSVQGYLFTKGKLASVRSRISPGLLEDKYEQRFVYVFRVLKVNYSVQRALNRFEVWKNETVSG